MNTRNLALHTTTWCSLLVIALTSLLPAGGVSLCIGADGHFAFGAAETGEECPCDDAGQAGGAEAPGQQHAPCSDLQFEAPTLVRDHGLTKFSVPTSDEVEVQAWLPQNVLLPGTFKRVGPQVLSALLLPDQWLLSKQVIVLII